MADEADRSWQRFAHSWPSDWDPPGSCAGGCGQPKERCICKPQPFKTLTQLVRETEADVTEEDLKGSGLTMEDWQNIRQWPEDK